MNPFLTHAEIAAQYRTEIAEPDATNPASVTYCGQVIPAIPSPFETETMLAPGGEGLTSVLFSNVLVRKTDIPDGIIFRSTTPITVTDPFGVSHRCKLNAIHDQFSMLRLHVTDVSQAA